MGYLFERIVAFENLLAAYHRARRGKRGRPSVERFSRRLEPELFALQAAVTAGTWRPGRSVTFTIHDPKPRRICVAPFADRVLHHAVMRVIQPVIERGMDADSFGCRVGKGTDGAIRRAHQLARRCRWVLKADVASFFASIRHDILIGQLCRLFKDRRLLDLLGRIVTESDAGAERGLPLGNLTSQWFANLYLTPLDRRIRRDVDAMGMVRYMDDVLVFGQNAEGLRRVRDAASEFLQTALDLRLKATVTRLFRTEYGVPFLGFRVMADRVAVRRPTWQRFRRRLKHLEWQHRRGEMMANDVAMRAASMIAHLRRADSFGLRARWLSDHPHQAREW